MTLFDVAYADEVFCNLHGVECGTLLNLVADEPEGNAIGVCEILSDTAYKDIVAVLVEEGHGVRHLTI